MQSLCANANELPQEFDETDCTMIPLSPVPAISTPAYGTGCVRYVTCSHTLSTLVDAARQTKHLQFSLHLQLAARARDFKTWNLGIHNTRASGRVETMPHTSPLESAFVATLRFEIGKVRSEQAVSVSGRQSGNSVMLTSASCISMMRITPRCQVE